MSLYHNIEHIESYDQENLYLFFELNDRSYAIKTSYVLEIMQLPQLDIPQKMPKNIIGIMNYSGLSINIIDLRVLLNLPVSSYSINDSLIVIKTAESILALLVNKINNIVHIESNKMQTIPYTTSDNLIDNIYHNELQSVSVININFLEKQLKETDHQLVDDINKKLFPSDQESLKIFEKRKLYQYNKVKQVLDSVQQKEQYLLFNVSDVNLSIDISYIKHIEKNYKDKIVKLPSVPKYIYGIINIKGEFLTLLDLALFLNFNQIKEQDYKNLIIIENQNISIGLLVNEIYKIKSFRSNDLVKRTENQFESRYSSADIIEDNKVYSILNVDNILNDDKLYIKQS